MNELANVSLDRIKKIKEINSLSLRKKDISAGMSRLARYARSDESAKKRYIADRKEQRQLQEKIDSLLQEIGITSAKQRDEELTKFKTFNRTLGLLLTKARKHKYEKPSSQFLIDIEAFIQEYIDDGDKDYALYAKNEFADYIEPDQKQIQSNQEYKRREQYAKAGFEAEAKKAMNAEEKEQVKKLTEKAQFVTSHANPFGGDDQSHQDEKRYYYAKIKKIKENAIKRMQSGQITEDHIVVSRFQEYLESSGFEKELDSDADKIYKHLKALKDKSDDFDIEAALDNWVTAEWMVGNKHNFVSSLGKNQYTPSRLRNLKAKVRRKIRGR